MKNNRRRNRYINNKYQIQENGTKRLGILLAFVLILAVCIVLFILSLRRMVSLPNEEKAISMEEIEDLLTELPEEERGGFREICRRTEAEKGYLPFEETLQKLITYFEEHSPELELGYKHLGLITVNDNTILTKNKNDNGVKLYHWQNKGKVNIEQLSPGDELTVLGTKDKVLLLQEKKESEVFLEAAWVMSSSPERISLKYEDYSINLPNNTLNYRGYEDIADISIKTGGITRVKVYTDKINKKLLCIKDGKIELEGVGEVPYVENIQVYKLFGDYEPYTLSDLKIGYAFTDFVKNENKEIVAALVKEEGYLDKIRVVIKNTDFTSAYHEKVSFTCDAAMEWKSGDMSGTISPGEEMVIDGQSELFQDNRIIFTPQALTAKTTISSITRSQGRPAYRGCIEIERCEEGLLVVNELLLDEYLYSVVPSEMPSYYPMEALKAQAVSARTYAYSHMKDSRLQSYGAHVDDSAAFQVYNNINESDSCTKAVRETEGIIVSKDGMPVTTYFYSTSCGYGTDLSAWNVENDSYLQAKKLAPNNMDGIRDEVSAEGGTPADMRKEEIFSAFIKNPENSYYEGEETYYRWKYETELDTDLLTLVLQERYKANPHQILTETSQGFVQREIAPIGDVYKIQVLSRSEGGAVCEMLIEAKNAVVKVISEKNIRYILANESTELMLGADYTKEGTVNGMLPSAFVTIEPSYDNRAANADSMIGYTIWGGGFGHGIGMSQNAAKCMAEQGVNYRDILQFFYVGTNLENLKE